MSFHILFLQSNIFRLFIVHVDQLQMNRRGRTGRRMISYKLLSGLFARQKSSVFTCFRSNGEILRRSIGFVTFGTFILQMTLDVDQRIF